MQTVSETAKVTLYYRQGASDKVYHVAIEPSGTGFVVNFAFGRRGSTLQTGAKTAAPVDYPEAKKIFDKLIREKTAKGYTPGQDGTPYRHTGNAERSTGILPQLLNPIDEAQVVARHVVAEVGELHALAFARAAAFAFHPAAKNLPAHQLEFFQLGQEFRR